MLNSLSTMLLVALGTLVFVGWGAFAVSSILERERRAAVLSSGIATVGLLLALLGLLLPIGARLAVLVVIAAVIAAGVIALLQPSPLVEGADDQPQSRVDERDTIFARAGLIPGTIAYDTYYAGHPEEKRIDDRIRELPGVLSPGAVHANRFAFAAADSSFTMTEALHSEVDGPVAEEVLELSPSAATRFVKGLARFYGARRVGITELRPYHLYTHVGRGSGSYGALVTLDHPYAIAFTVEMDYRIMRRAPRAPVVMESAHQYVEAARVAVQLACVLRSLGYCARAHIDGDYRVIAPLVARDAGLGQIGRMSILMTPHLGPRVRLAVVTTDIPLVPDLPAYDVSVIDFCRGCEKCAEVCPSQAIPRGDREEVEGVLRWMLDAEACFRFWNAAGTDCGLCIAVCPYSHPDTWAHNVVRQAIRRAAAARRMALWVDDALYGRAVPPRPPLDWLPPDD